MFDPIVVTKPFDRFSLWANCSAIVVLCLCFCGVAVVPLTAHWPPSDDHSKVNELGMRIIGTFEDIRGGIWLIEVHHSRMTF